MPHEVSLSELVLELYVKAVGYNHLSSVTQLTEVWYLPTPSLGTVIKLFGALGLPWVGDGKLEENENKSFESTSPAILH